MLLNFFVPLSSALTQENSAPVPDNDNGVLPDNWLFLPPENSPDLPENSLISYWSFDDVQENVVRNGVEDQPGFPIDGPSWQVEGKIGYAMHFDGKDDVLENEMAWEFENLSIALWVRAENLEGNHSPISKSWGLARSGEFFLSIVDNGRHFDFAMWTSDYRQELFAENVNFAADTWYHLVAAYDGKRMTLFVDGENVACKNASGYLAYTPQPLRVGRNGRVPWWWAGDIDEVYIYNHALSPEEVLDLYGVGAVVDNTPPSSSVLPFGGDDYWKELETIGSDSFTVSAEAVDDVGVENVELWYRCSLDNWTDNSSWGRLAR